MSIEAERLFLYLPTWNTCPMVLLILEVRGSSLKWRSDSFAFSSEKAADSPFMILCQRGEAAGGYSLLLWRVKALHGGGSASGSLEATRGWRLLLSERLYDL